MPRSSLSVKAFKSSFRKIMFSPLTLQHRIVFFFFYMNPLWRVFSKNIWRWSTERRPDCRRSFWHCALIGIKNDSIKTSVYVELTKPSGAHNNYDGGKWGSLRREVVGENESTKHWTSPWESTVSFPASNTSTLVFVSFDPPSQWKSSFKDLRAETCRNLHL